MTWQEFYDNFYDWAESTQIRKLSSVDTYGPADEVAEVMSEFALNHEEITNCMARKAIEQKIVFSADNLTDLVNCMDESVLNQLVLQSVEGVSPDDLKDMYGLIDDEILAKIYRMKGWPVPEELEGLTLAENITNLIDYVDQVSKNGFSKEQSETKEKKPRGLFSKLAMTFAVGEGVRQGIVEVAAPKPHRFYVGDHVRVRWRGQEGTVIDISGDLYLVRLKDGGFVDSYAEDQLEKDL